MSEHESKRPPSEDPRSHSPVSVISRFSYEEYRDSNNGESPHPGHGSRASRTSSISASSQLSAHRIGLARPLSAAIISSNDRFTSSVTPEQARGNGLDSTEQIISDKDPTATTEPCEQDQTESDKGRERSMWNPFWLWRTTLIGFILVLVLLVVVLVILYHFSNMHHGLSTQISSHYYSWTYGPTAGRSNPNKRNHSILIETSFRDPSLFVAASRLLLQDSFTVEGNAGTISSSRNKLVSRLYLPQPHKQLIGRME